MPLFFRHSSSNRYSTSETHAYDETVPVEASVKLTVSGASPEVGVAAKSATGAPGNGSLTTMYSVFTSESLPPSLETVRLTV